MRLVEIVGTNMELTAAIKDYVEKKLELTAKVTEKMEPCDVRAEVGKTTHHHAKGDVFRTEFNLTVDGGFFRAESTKDDLYASIDEAASDLRRQVVAHKEKLRAGARVVAEMESLEHEFEEEISE
jgi:putative sigma-54 modulation protein